MPRICYLEKNLRTKALYLITKANEIIAEYAAQGFELTLRQCYYQFVARNLLPNTEKSYKLLGDSISDGRLGGMIDWNAIVDRTRSVRENAHWTSPSDIVEACSKQFKIDKWHNQNARCIVMVEKDALIGVVEGISRELDVPCISCRGYTSQTAMWQLGQKIVAWIDDNREVSIFHLGDHDPSGIDMSRDIEDRLRMFVGHHAEEEMMSFARLALNMSQVEEYTPPPNPAKITDSRAASYISQYGSESWELDALEPAVLVGLIRDAVLEVRNEKLWDEAVEKESGYRKTLHNTARKLARGGK